MRFKPFILAVTLVIVAVLFLAPAIVTSSQRAVVEAMVGPTKHMSDKMVNVVFWNTLTGNGTRQGEFTSPSDLGVDVPPFPPQQSTSPPQ